MAIQVNSKFYTERQFEWPLFEKMYKKYVKGLRGCNSSLPGILGGK